MRSDAAATLVELLGRLARSPAKDRGFTYLAEGEGAGVLLTFAANLLVNPLLPGAGPARILRLATPVRAMFCAPGRTRTYDRQIRRLLLYPLSYGGLGTRRPSAVRTGIASL